MHGQHLLGQLAEHADRHRAAAEVRPGPALDRDRAGHQQLAVLVDLGAGLDRASQHRRVGRQPQPALDDRPAWPARTRPASARPPKSRSSPVTTIVLPAPVSPVTTVSPGPSSSVASSMTPRPGIRISASTPEA